MIKQLFYFDDHLRWSFIFENPNVAGAFIAILLSLPLAFENFGTNKRTLAIAFLIEFILWICLIGTYSRGAFVAALSCAIIHYCIFIARSKFSSRFKILFFTLKTVLLIILAFSFGFSKRISGDYLRSDGSTNARITLWRGGLEMLAQNPVLGWGKNSSGEEYMNWFQDSDDGRMYGGMVNSYLHIAVERGLPTLALALFILSTFIIISIKESISSIDHVRKVSFAMSGFAWCAFAIANIFSTLWIFPSLSVATICISAPTVIAGSFNKKINFTSLVSCVKISLLLALCTTSLLFLAGLLSRRNISVKKLNGFYEISLYNSKKTKNILILTDKSVLGDLYGKEIRNLFNSEHAKDLNVIVVNEDNCANKELRSNNYDAMVIFGKRVKDATSFKTNTLYIVNPIGSPFKADYINAKVYLILSKFDTFNQHAKWKSMKNTDSIIIKELDFGTQRIENVFDIISAIN